MLRANHGHQVCAIAMRRLLPALGAEFCSEPHLGGLGAGNEASCLRGLRGVPVRTGLNYSFGMKKYCHQIRTFHGIFTIVFANFLQFFGIGSSCGLCREAFEDLLYSTYPTTWAKVSSESARRDLQDTHNSAYFFRKYLY